MAKDQADYAQENTQRAMQAASVGANWMAEIAEQNLNQGKVTVEGMLTIVSKVSDGFVQQASAVQEHSVSLAEEMAKNAFEFGNKMIRVRSPEEWAEAQSEFLSRQAQTFSECSKSLGQRLVQETKEATATSLNEARKRTKAA
jgi:translation initiation factor 2 alpha subunit (eIF-2alpha)